MYKRFFKRFFDIVCALLVFALFWWVFLVIAVLVKVKLGGPVIFKQPRPGLKGSDGREKVFIMYKFRSMTNECDENGELLPDGKRLTKFGKILRDTSLDEIPEFWNVLKGDMSLIGPRPQLVRDMVFMTDEQRNRHNVRPGISGLAQINGRNCIKWEDKLDYDLRYTQKIGFVEDLKIVFITVVKVFKTESISYEGMATAEDYGVYLLRTGKITREEFERKNSEAERIIKDAGFSW